MSRGIEAARCAALDDELERILEPMSSKIDRSIFALRRLRRESSRWADATVGTPQVHEWWAARAERLGAAIAILQETREAPPSHYVP